MYVFSSDTIRDLKFSPYRSNRFIIIHNWYFVKEEVSYFLYLMSETARFSVCHVLVYDHQTVQPVASRYTDWAIWPTRICSYKAQSLRGGCDEMN